MVLVQSTSTPRCRSQIFVYPAPILSIGRGAGTCLYLYMMWDDLTIHQESTWGYEDSTSHRYRWTDSSVPWNRRGGREQQENITGSPFGPRVQVPRRSTPTQMVFHTFGFVDTSRTRIRPRSSLGSPSVCRGGGESKSNSHPNNAGTRGVKVDLVGLGPR